MTQLDMIKKKVAYLYSVSPKIHVNVRLNHPRLEFKNDVVKIKGVYNNIFRIEECCMIFLKSDRSQTCATLTRFPSQAYAAIREAKQEVKSGGELIDA